MKKRIPIVILHGWSLSGIKFDPLKNVLENEGWQVFAPTMPGFDGTIPPKPYVLDDYVNFILMFLKEHKIGPAIFIGHSFGGRVAIKLAVRAPQLVVSLVLTGAPGYSSAPWYKLWTAIVVAKLGKLLFATPFLLPAQDAIRSFYYLIIGVKDYTKANPIMRVTFKNVVSESLQQPMKQITSPTLLVWGKQDQLVPVLVAKRMLKTIASSSLVLIPFTDHGVPFREPEKFYKASRDFLLSFETPESEQK